MSIQENSQTLESLRANIEHVRNEIARAAERAGRDAAAVTLLAVTKYVDADAVRLLYQAGARDIGENTVQSLMAKSEALSDLADIRWHLIGHLQRNKAARAVQAAASIQSVDSERLLREIGKQVTRRGVALPELYIEVNVARERQKTGLPPDALRDLLGLAQEPGLLPSSGDRNVPRQPVRGLMAMAPWSEEPEDSRPYFRRLRNLRDALIEEGLLPAGADLSMGMSGDFRVAVEEGATCVRVGTLLFEGTRCARSPGESR